jgi:uracil-DNA glycosylase family 4
MTEAERREALEAIAAEVRACTRCRLHETRTRAVPGEGHPSTEVVFVGEGPGMNEDRQGRPFVGRAGDLLVKLLGTIGWRRDEVFITNIVKCRPPDNRDPEPDEIAACAPYLRRQLEALDPALVVTLGRHSLGRFMPGDRIGQVHGTYRPVDPSTGARAALGFALYHPAAALRSSEVERQSYDDIRGVPAALTESRERRERVVGIAVAEAAPEAPEREAALEAPERESAPEREAALETASAPADGGTTRESQAVPEAEEREPELALAAGSSPDTAAISAPLLVVGPDRVDRVGHFGERSGPTAEPHDLVDRIAPAPHSVPDPADTAPVATPSETGSGTVIDSDALLSGGADNSAAPATALSLAPVRGLTGTTTPPLATPPTAVPATAVPATPPATSSAATSPNPTTPPAVEPVDQLTAF